MDESTAAVDVARGDGDDTDVRSRITALLRWAEADLDLLAWAFRGCTEEELDAARQALGVDRLPVAYEEFLARMGAGGPGSALVEIFPGADVALDSILPGEDWPGSRRLAAEVLREHGVERELGAGEVVIRVYRTEEVEWIPADGDDPPVYAVRDGVGAVRTHDSFTAWLEHGIGRAIKRRYPLRSSHFREVEPPGTVLADEDADDWMDGVEVEEILVPPSAALADDDGDDWFADLVPEDAVEEILVPPSAAIDDDAGEDWFAGFDADDAEPPVPAVPDAAPVVEQDWFADFTPDDEPDEIVLPPDATPVVEEDWFADFDEAALDEAKPDDDA